MARIDPLEDNDLAEFGDLFAAVAAGMGFVPNSLKTMARRPALLKTFAVMAREILSGASSLPPGLRKLVSNVTSRTSGCQYCVAHTAEASARAGVEVQKVAAVFDYESSPLFSEAERAALNFAQCAASVPNAVDDADMARLKEHYSEEQIVEIMGVISLFGFLNRWNDSLATTLEDQPTGFASENLAASEWRAGKHGNRS
jgi:uncharacterized peroxidase-related enzyme